MYLLIDLTKRGNIHLVWFDMERRRDMEYAGKHTDVLSSLDNFFSDCGAQKTEVKGIMAVVGTGSFTSTRLAVTIANTFGYVFDIPLLSLGAEDVALAQQFIPKLLIQPKGQYLSAVYSSEPTIGSRL